MTALWSCRSRLLRTRDATATWRDIAGVPALSNPVLAAGPVFGEFFLGAEQQGLVAPASSGGLYMLGGTQWVAASGAPGGPIAAGSNGVVVVGDGGAKLGLPGSIGHSVDAGATWHPAAGLPYDQSVEAAPASQHRALLRGRCLCVDGRWGYLRTADEGASHPRQLRLD